jgi:LysR family transcriptional regulator, transcription activator of glutamate synthase operon
MAIMNAELRDIRYFAGVVEHGSLTRAARELNVSQPALSHAIARLEEALGGPLWQRLPNRRAGVAPTELGQRVLSRGGRALAELSALEQDAAMLRGVEAGELRVGSVQSLAGTLLPRWVALFMERYPKLVLELPLVSSEAAPELIRAGKLHAALIVGPSPNDPALRHLRCGEQQLVLVLRADHALARRRRVALSALARQPLVLFSRGTLFARAIDEVCARAGFVPEARARLASISGLCALVRAQVGLTILPEGSVPFGDPELVEVHFERPVPKRSVQLVWRADVQPPPALAAFLTVVKSINA